MSSKNWISVLVLICLVFANPVTLDLTKIQFWHCKILIGHADDAATYTQMKHSQLNTLLGLLYVL